ncbi:BQ5605_C008g05342 [Microbotryum silenes-dioicae]|uniref:BQ5605_C008g05342 protein n=1 Tax=Microbotryum silenes-dioicae TaxID=796604 RepID=A0A2X0MG70_9BASI|nr:BQ5605_C008g05342 [Microbotryum silenes-dioicae]
MNAFRLLLQELTEDFCARDFNTRSRKPCPHAGLPQNFPKHAPAALGQFRTACCCRTSIRCVPLPPPAKDLPSDTNTQLPPSLLPCQTTTDSCPLRTPLLLNLPCWIVD